MKWLVLALGIALAVQAGRWLRTRDSLIPWLWVIIGVLPFLTSGLHLYMAVVAWPTWPGYVKGVEVSILDMLAVAAFVAAPKGAPLLAYPLTMLFYMGTILLSATHAEYPITAEFDAWQLLKMFVLTAAVSRACADRRVAPALMLGLAIGIGIEAVVTFYENKTLGSLQATGTYVHQNTLGLISNLVVLPFVGLFLAKPGLSRASLLLLAGTVVVLLTVSRASFGMFLIGFGLLMLFSLLRQFTVRKLWAVLAVCAIGAAMVPIAQAQFAARFAAEPLDKLYDERKAFEKAASLILKDHPFGIGANNYVVIVNIRGYNDKAFVAETAGSRAANVHNAYLLTAAETGYIGQFAFILWLLPPVFSAFYHGWRHVKDVRGDLLVGLGVACIVTYIHNMFEWIFVTFDAQYVYAIIVGLIVGISRQLIEERAKAGDQEAARQRSAMPDPGLGAGAAVGLS